MERHEEEWPAFTRKIKEYDREAEAQHSLRALSIQVNNIPDTSKKTLFYSGKGEIKR